MNLARRFLRLGAFWALLASAALPGLVFGQAKTSGQKAVVRPVSVLGAPTLGSDQLSAGLPAEPLSRGLNGHLSAPVPELAPSVLTTAPLTDTKASQTGVQPLVHSATRTSGLAAPETSPAQQDASPIHGLLENAPLAGAAASRKDLSTVSEGSRTNFYQAARLESGADETTVSAGSVEVPAGVAAHPGLKPRPQRKVPDEVYHAPAGLESMVAALSQEMTWGFEPTFTNEKMEDHKSLIDANRDLLALAMKAELSREQLAGWNIGTDPGVVEVRPPPQTLKTILPTMRALFEAARKVGLPSEIAFGGFGGGGGHIHIGRNIFDKNPLLLRNLLVDVYNRPYIKAMLDEMGDVGNAASIQQRGEDARFRKSIAEFDERWRQTRGELDIEAALRIFAGLYKDERYRDVNLTNLYGKGLPTVELRAHRAQRTPEDFYDLAEFWLYRIANLSLAKGPIRLEPASGTRRQDLMLPSAAATLWRKLVRESGLPRPERYERFVRGRFARPLRIGPSEKPDVEIRFVDWGESEGVQEIYEVLVLNPAIKDIKVGSKRVALRESQASPGRPLSRAGRISLEAGQDRIGVSGIPGIASIDISQARRQVDVYRSLPRRINSTESLRFLEKVLGDPEPRLRKVAVRALYGRAGPGVLPLIQKALDDPEPSVRAYAAQALQDRTDAASSRLMRKALGDPHPGVREYAADALYGRTDAGSLRLIRAVLDDPEPDVRESAARALVGRTDAESLEFIQKALEDTDTNVRRYAARALQKRPDARSLKSMRIALGAPDLGVRRDAADVLRRRTDVESLGLIQKALDDSDPYVRACAARALYGRTDAESLRLIEKALGDPDAFGRRYAAGSLLGRMDEKSLELIKKALRDPVPDVRGVAAGALAGRADSESLGFLEKALGDPDASVRRFATGALRGRTDEESLRLVGKVQDDMDPYVRGFAAGALHGRANAEAPKLAEKALNDPDAYVRGYSAGALLGRADVESLGLMLEDRGDPDPGERQYDVTAAPRARAGAASPRKR